MEGYFYLVKRRRPTFGGGTFTAAESASNASMKISTSDVADGQCFR
jgi:hypothetical protein